jgi:hypothetical protein
LAVIAYLFVVPPPTAKASVEGSRSVLNFERPAN